mmetsp:Transcript_30210/g.89710  ORF Transcript_30210/g.89710 Transcript_30210/m.89710 type:complete len:336 (+) Transcript_30210:106-1113(+)
MPGPRLQVLLRVDLHRRLRARGARGARRGLLSPACRPLAPRRRALRADDRDLADDRAAHVGALLEVPEREAVGAGRQDQVGEAVVGVHIPERETQEERGELHDLLGLGRRGRRHGQRGEVVRRGRRGDLELEPVEELDLLLEDLRERDDAGLPAAVRQPLEDGRQAGLVEASLLRRRGAEHLEGRANDGQAEHAQLRRRNRLRGRRAVAVQEGHGRVQDLLGEAQAGADLRHPADRELAVLLADASLHVAGVGPLALRLQVPAQEALGPLVHLVAPDRRRQLLAQQLGRRRRAPRGQRLHLRWRSRVRADPLGGQAGGARPLPGDFGAAVLVAPQ